MDTASIISLCFSGVTLLVLLINFFGKKKEDIKSDTEEDQRELASLREGIFKANMKLDQVCSTTNETRTDIKALYEVINKHGERISILEYVTGVKKEDDK